MNPESDFRIESTYDRQAYQAMAKATWKLFQKHRMEVMAYPAPDQRGFGDPPFCWYLTGIIRPRPYAFGYMAFIVLAVRGDPPGRRACQDVPESDP